MRQLWWIWPPSAGLHVGKLIAQRSDVLPSELCGDGCHEGMIYARAGAMR
jgi:hypothetical protein